MAFHKEFLSGLPRASGIVPREAAGRPSTWGDRSERSAWGMAFEQPAAVYFDPHPAASRFDWHFVGGEIVADFAIVDGIVLRETFSLDVDATFGRV